MATPFIGKGTAVGFGSQSVWETSVARTNWLKLNDWNVKRQLINESLGHLAQGTAGEVDDEFEARDETTGPFSVLSRYVGLGFLIEAALGSVLTSGGPTFVHTYELALALPSLTLEGIRGSTAVSDVVTGAKINNFVLSGAANEIVRARFEILGKTITTPRPAAGTPTFGTGEFMLHKHTGQLSFNGNLFTMKSWELTLPNQLARVDELGTSETAEPVCSAFREPMLRAVLVARDNTLKEEQLARTQGDATFTLTGAVSPNAMTINLRNARLRVADDPITGPGPYEVTAEFRGFADVSDSGLSIAITNAESDHFANG